MTERATCAPQRSTTVRASAATGGAALGPETFRFFQAMGVPLRTLYGQTELLGAYTLHPEGKVDPDTTGVPMASILFPAASVGFSTPIICRST
mgnify:CR=1 FL=1